MVQALTKADEVGSALFSLSSSFERLPENALTYTDCLYRINALMMRKTLDVQPAVFFVI